MFSGVEEEKIEIAVQCMLRDAAEGEWFDVYEKGSNLPRVGGQDVHGGVVNEAVL